jgi:trehalose utilization protein
MWMRWTLAVIGLYGVAFASTGCARSAAINEAGRPIRVVVWDERQKEQLHAYGGVYLGDSIAQFLTTRGGMEVRSVGQSEYHDLASMEKLVADCDVLIWWGHMLHDQIAPEVGQMIVRRIKDGRLNLIALHSAHWATPFVEAMYERTRMDMAAAFRSEPGPVQFEYPMPPGKMDVFRAGLARLRTGRQTPWAEPRKFPEGHTVVTVHLPHCVFPAFREDGKPSHIFTVLPDHPIAQGLPPRFTLAQTEMYDEPFHIPAPDAVVFEERWDTGEWFRSGCVWELGSGRVFYFRPGHETYPIFKQELPLRILENAVRWMGAAKDRL